MQKKCVIIPNGIQVRNYPSKNNPEYDGRIRIIFLGSLDRWKGIILAINSFSNLNIEREIELHIGGDGPLRNYVESCARKNSKIIYHGVISPENLSDFYSQGDIFLYPSLGETFGLVVLEAIYHGLYVLAGKNLKGNFDDLENNRYLRYCPYDLSTLTAYLRDSIENVGNLRKMKSEMKKYVSEKYSWEVITNRLSDFFVSIMNENKF